MKDLTAHKAELQKEYETLIEDLKGLGRVNPDNLNDWETTPPDAEFDPADPNEAADKYEDYENNTAILDQLEMRFNKVKVAMEKIEKGVYGKCEKCNKEIEEDRLDADPAATTCIAHINS